MLQGITRATFNLEAFLSSVFWIFFFFFYKSFFLNSLDAYILSVQKKKVM